MRKIKIYTAGLKEVKEMGVPKGIASEEVNEELLGQAAHVYRDREHLGLSRVKSRSEITRTKKKWYRQKGTGRARHGARSAPIFVGGGVAHGPKGVKRELALPRKMGKQALAEAIGYKANDGKMAVLGGLSKVKKTKEAYELVNRVGDKAGKKLVVLEEGNWEKKRFFANISGLMVERWKDLNAYKVVNGGLLLIDGDVFGGKAKKKEGAKR